MHTISGIRHLIYDRSCGHCTVPSVELRKGHGGKSFSECTSGNRVPALGLCPGFVHTVDFGGRVSSSNTGAWELPRCGSQPVGCAPGVAVSGEGKGQALLWVISSLCHFGTAGRSWSSYRVE